MKDHEHEMGKPSTTKPVHDEVAKKAYDIYQKEGHPQGHADENWSEAESGPVRNLVSASRKW